MRRKIVAGNWKMNLEYSEALELITDITNLEFPLQQANVSVIVAVPFTYLKDASEIVLGHSNFFIAAQNCSDKDKGAYTGEISAAMLKSVGTQYVIIGHSERRSYYQENNQCIKEKIDMALQYNLQPILCVGELLDERNLNQQFAVVQKQIDESTQHLNAQQFTNIILAYEPVWAIGTGITATPQQAQEMHAFIRKCISVNYGDTLANQISILYGGSCNESNAKELFSGADIDGGLIGGASLKVDSFAKIIEALL